MRNSIQSQGEFEQDNPSADLPSLFHRIGTLVEYLLSVNEVVPGESKCDRPENKLQERSSCFCENNFGIPSL